MQDTRPIVFSLDDVAWARAAAEALRLPIARHEERRFEDGEHKCRPLENVRRRDVFILQSLHADATGSVNDKLCRLLFFIGALKDAAAASVTAVVPYLCYSRKDRKTQPGDPVTTRYVAALFEAAGTDRIVTLDVHNIAAYQNAFRCRAEHLEAAGLFAAHFAGLLAGRQVAVVSPDAGGLKRAERFRKALEASLGRPVAMALAEKHRGGGVVRGDLLVGDVSGRCAIIVDDLISTGTTIVRTAVACRNLGALSVHAAATHGLFVGEAGTLLADAAVTGIVVTDSVPSVRLPPGPARDKLTILGTGRFFAEAIGCIHAGGRLDEVTGAGPLQPPPGDVPPAQGSAASASATSGPTDSAPRAGG